MMGSDCGIESMKTSTGRSWTMTPKVLPLSRLMKLADSRYCAFSYSSKIFYQKQHSHNIAKAGKHGFKLRDLHKQSSEERLETIKVGTIW